jgi:flagellar assembly protein FliH
MAQVISKESLQRHNIDKYNFKVLAIGGNKKPIKQNQQTSFETQTNNEIKEENNTTVSSQNTQSNKDSIIESLLKKTDEMSSNFIKLQMKLESMQEEHKVELQKVKEQSYQEGLQAGIEQANKECETKYNQTLNLFSDSISKLEEKANEYNNALENIKKELVSAAIDIAIEVVNVELQENSNEIALKLANSLIDELKDASTITLKVNPNDFSFISTKLNNLKNIKVVADSAISPGGVIALSDIENIDAQIEKRFEKVKKVILSE